MKYLPEQIWAGCRCFNRKKDEGFSLRFCTAYYHNTRFTGCLADLLLAMDNTTSVHDAHPPPSTDVQLPTCALTTSRRKFRWKETVAQPPKQLCCLCVFTLIVLFNVKKESHLTSEGRFRGQETLWITSPLSAQKERGEKSKLWLKVVMEGARRPQLPSLLPL